jgi:hypothetical protein
MKANIFRLTGYNTSLEKVAEYNIDLKSEMHGSPLDKSNRLSVPSACICVIRVLKRDQFKRLKVCAGPVGVALYWLCAYIRLLTICPVLLIMYLS